jgi:hypothetical protein
VTVRPPIKGRITPINGSTPVALYQWNLLERQKPGIPLIKGIATLVQRLIVNWDKGNPVPKTFSSTLTPGLKVCPEPSGDLYQLLVSPPGRLKYLGHHHES